MPYHDNNSRRAFLQRAGLGLLAATLPVYFARSATAHPGVMKGPAPADEALRQLQAGNPRFQKGKLLHPNETLQRRRDVALKQTPIATVLAVCQVADRPAGFAKLEAGGIALSWKA